MVNKRLMVLCFLNCFSYPVCMSKSRQHSAKSVLLQRPVETLIFVIRGQKVMLDRDLGELYDVKTALLNRAVKRNPGRFPDDIMFQLTHEEAAGLRCQSGISKTGRGGTRYLPYAFTEHGVVMLSSVLNSQRAIQANLLIIRAFVRMRELMATNKDIAARVEKLERGHDRAVSIIEVLVDDIDRLGRKMETTKPPSPYSRRRIGYIVDED
jgi:ORF6N domain-containing protein